MSASLIPPNKPDNPRPDVEAGNGFYVCVYVEGPSDQGEANVAVTAALDLARRMGAVPQLSKCAIVIADDDDLCPN